MTNEQIIIKLIEKVFTLEVSIERKDKEVNEWIERCKSRGAMLDESANSVKELQHMVSERNVENAELRQTIKHFEKTVQTISQENTSLRKGCNHNEQD